MEFEKLGNIINQPSKELEVFPKPPNVSEVEFECLELTALCPITNQPDYYTVSIHFCPVGLCLESKSLKLYLWTFREEKMFAESLASQIVDDLYDTLKSKWITVILTQNIRGGMQLKVTARKYND